MLFTILNVTCAMQVMLVTPKDLGNNFSILKKCKSKFDCLVFEMFFINELRPSLNVQSDSLRAKVFE